MKARENYFSLDESIRLFLRTICQLYSLRSLSKCSTFLFSNVNQYIPNTTPPPPHLRLSVCLITSFPPPPRPAPKNGLHKVTPVGLVSSEAIKDGGRRCTLGIVFDSFRAVNVSILVITKTVYLIIY